MSLASRLVGLGTYSCDGCIPRVSVQLNPPLYLYTLQACTARSWIAPPSRAPIPLAASSTHQGTGDGGQARGGKPYAVRTLSNSMGVLCKQCLCMPLLRRPPSPANRLVGLAAVAHAGAMDRRLFKVQGPRAGAGRGWSGSR